MQGFNASRLLKRVGAIVAIPGLLLALLAGLFGAANAQGNLPPRRVEIGGLDISQFPDVGVNLIVTDRQSRPLRELGAVRLRESGVPIADYETTLVTAGTDVFMVVDANSRIQEADDESGQTRLQKVRDSILVYAGRFMDLAGRDHVTVIVPDGDEGRMLVEDVTAPGELIEAVQAYEPGRLPESSVIDLVALALERAATTKEAGRFQAVVLYTDASGLNEARLEPLVARAEELQTPIFVLLLGAGETPSEDAIAAATALAAPTRGLFDAMPAASDSSDILQVIADNAVQTQLRYQSNIRRSGTYSVAVSLDNLRAETSLELSLQAPVVQLDAPSIVERAGTVPDAPLEELQPTVQTVTAVITWPDGIARRLQGAALLANGRAQEAPFFGGDGIVQFDWSVAELDAGLYELTVIVTDTLGFAAQSGAQDVTIALARPQPAPTPSPAPTAQPLAALRSLVPPLPGRDVVEPYLAPVGVALLLLAIIFVARRARGRQGEEESVAGFGDDWEEEESSPGPAGSGERAFLQRLASATVEMEEENLWLVGDNVTIGSAEEAVSLHIEEPAISGLHARIRRRGGEYWLYDEGSEHGTLLNHERLGLAPRRIRDGDEIQLGRARYRFRVQKEGGIEHVGREGEAQE